MDFQVPVSEYMTHEVEAVTRATRLPEIANLFERWNISAVPVLDGDAIVGVVSRTDLLRIGRVMAATGRRGAALSVPWRRAEDVMTASPLVVGVHTTLASAAQVMIGEHVHRVFVVDSGRLVGVLTAIDLAAAVRDAQIEAAIDTIMSAPILTIATTDPIERALERLERARVSGLVVVEDDWPVGLFTQVEAMAARDLPRDTPVEDVFDQALICLPRATKLHRAAAQAARLEVRRVIVCDERQAVGIVTGLDFTRVVAGAA